MKFTLDSIGEETHVQNVGRGLRVYMNGISFNEDTVSRIEIYKFTANFSNDSEPSLMIVLYSGNMRLATWVVNEVVIAEDRYSPNNSERQGALYGYTIRLPHEWDK